MKNQKITTDSDILLNRAKTRVAQHSFGIATILVMSFMVVNIFGIGFDMGVHAETTNNTNLTLNVATGALELVNVEATVAFSAGQAGVKSNETATVNDATIRDYRATPNGFKIYANSAGLTGAGDSNFILAAANMTIDGTNDMDATNIDGNYGTHLNFGPLGNLDGAGTGLLNSNAVTSGALQLDNLIVNAQLNAEFPADDYIGIFTFTLVAGE